MTRRTELAAGAALVFHGLAHSLPGMRAVDRVAGWPLGDPASASPALVAVATLLWASAMVGLVAAGFGLWGARRLSRVWRTTATLGAGASLLLLGGFRPEYALPGALLSAGILFTLWRAGPERLRPARTEGTRFGRALGFASTLILAYLTLAIILRPWHMRWGATDLELAAALPGDELAERPLRYGIQHGVTIRAPVAEVWPWLVQMGQDRAGFYSYDRLERLFGARIRNVDRIVPEWQELSGGDSVFATQPGYLGLVERRLGWRVSRRDPGHAILLENWDAFVVQPEGPDTTRLIARTRGVGRTSSAELLLAPAGLLLFELPHFIMLRRMLLGIRDLAEGAAGDPIPEDAP